LIKGTVQDSWSFDLHCLLVSLSRLSSPKQHKPYKALQLDLGWLAVRSQKPAIHGGSLTEVGILLVKDLWEQSWKPKTLQYFHHWFECRLGIRAGRGSDKRVRELDSDSDRCESSGVSWMIHISFNIAKVVHLGVKQHRPCLERGAASTRKPDCRYRQALKPSSQPDVAVRKADATLVCLKRCWMRRNRRGKTLTLQNLILGL